MTFFVVVVHIQDEEFTIYIKESFVGFVLLFPDPACFVRSHW